MDFRYLVPGRNVFSSTSPTSHYNRPPKHFQVSLHVLQTVHWYHGRTALSPRQFRLPQPADPISRIYNSPSCKINMSSPRVERCSDAHHQFGAGAELQQHYTKIFFLIAFHQLTILYHFTILRHVIHNFAFILSISISPYTAFRPFDIYSVGQMI